MDPMMVKEHPHDGEYSNGQWVEINEYQASHVPSPAQEYSNFNFMTTDHHGMHVDSYARPVQHIYPNSQQSQPVYPTQWPSMLTNAPTNAPPPPPPPRPPQQLAPPPPITPVTTYAPTSGLPPITTHQESPQSQQQSSNHRRTLTDQDRRRMCQYHEDNPSVKQTEIGAMFGVERSTVSKVLRQKEKYLFPEDGSRSPIKKAKGKFPDIERALSNWAKNHQRQGLPLNDNIIREKARFFATTVGSSDSHVKVNSNSWLEKFKQKNHLMGAKPRKESEGKTSESATKALKSEAQNSNDMSPISPTAALPSPSPLSASRSGEDLKTNSPDSYADYKHGHSQSATSLASGYTDITAPSTFSGAPQSPTSPFFSPEIVGGTNNFISPQQRSMSTGNVNSHRPRSQTFPILGIDPNFGGSNDNLTPKQVEEFMATSVLETPVDEYPERNFSVSSQELHQLSQPGSNVHSPVPTSSPSVMAPPPNPLITPTSTAASTIPSPIVPPPSQDEARRALELVMTFFQHQPNGVVDPQEYITMGKLMEKLKVQGSVGELPGGMHSLDRGQKEMSRKRSIHSL